MNGFGEVEITDGHKDQYPQEDTARLIVKEPTNKQQEDIAQVHSPPTILATTDNQRKHREDNRKERPEIELRKQQRVLCVKG